MSYVNFLLYYYCKTKNSYFLNFYIQICHLKLKNGQKNSRENFVSFVRWQTKIIDDIIEY